MRMNLWINNYKHPEQGQKKLLVLLQSRGKMAAAEKLFHSPVSSLCMEGRFYSFLQSSEAIPSYLEFFQEKGEF